VINGFSEPFLRSPLHDPDSCSISTHYCGGVPAWILREWQGPGSFDIGWGYLLPQSMCYADVQSRPTRIGPDASQAQWNCTVCSNYL